MKKSLIILLLLIVAGTANATLDWVVVGGGGAFMPGDVITLELVLSDDTATAVKIDLITDNGALGAIIDVFAAPEFDQGMGDGMDAYDFDNDLLGGTLGLDAGDWAFLDRFSTTTAIDGVLLTVKYMVGEDWWLTVINGEGLSILEDNNYVATLNGGLVTPPALELVPEPLSLVLLGVGGVLISRRRR